MYEYVTILKLFWVWINYSYSQTWELWPPKALGVSGPIFQVVSFARFGSKFFDMELYTCRGEGEMQTDVRRLRGVEPIGVHMPLQEPRHQRSVVPTCKRGRNWQRPCQAELANAMIACSECLRIRKEKLDNQKSVFRAIRSVWSLFAGGINT